MLKLHNHIRTHHSDIVLKRMSFIPQGGNWKDIPLEYRTKGKHSNLYKRFSEDEPCVTINNIRKSVFIHPFEDRGLSIREGARLQSFKDDYIFKGSLSSQQQQIGNAVPVLLAYNIGSSLMKLLSEDEN